MARTVCRLLTIITSGVQSTTRERHHRAVRHLAHNNPCYQRENPPAPQFEKLLELVLRELIPLPELDHPDAALPKLSPTS